MGDKKKDFEAITIALEESAKYGLTTEVIYSALREAQSNPEMSIDEIMFHAISEWDV